MSKGWKKALAAGLTVGAVCATATLVGAQVASKSKTPAPQASKPMSVDEARRVAAQTQIYVRPPRTIDDIAKILDQHKPDPAKIKKLLETADKKTPSNLNGMALADFLYERGSAARDLGRTQQRLADLRDALQAHQAVGDAAIDNSIARTTNADQSKRLRRLSGVYQCQESGDGTFTGRCRAWRPSRRSGRSGGFRRRRRRRRQNELRLHAEECRGRERAL